MRTYFGAHLTFFLCDRVSVIICEEVGAAQSAEGVLTGGQFKAEDGLAWA